MEPRLISTEDMPSGWRRWVFQRAQGATFEVILEPEQKEDGTRRYPDPCQSVMYRLFADMDRRKSLDRTLKRRR